MQSLDRKILPSYSCVLGTRSMDLHREPVISAHAHVTEGSLTVRRMFSFIYTTDWLIFNENLLEYSFIRTLGLSDQYQWWYLLEGGPCTAAKATVGGSLLQPCQYMSAHVSRGGLKVYPPYFQLACKLERTPLRQMLQGQARKQPLTL